jgi:ubiquinone/menaquinone biosynthesis C-methylase UbiE
VTQETAVWLHSYADPHEHRRRQTQMLRKLHRLGLDGADRGARIYDLCCGMGEALQALHEMGFRDLHGIDITAYPGVSADPRFEFRQGDVCNLDLSDESVDWLLSIHSLHHLKSPEHVAVFLGECYRVLKPGGQLGIIDFPASPQIQLAFRLFLVKPLLLTRYLKWFGTLISEEWHFLKGYLARWPATHHLLHHGPLPVVSYRQEFFYYYLRLAKPSPGL